MTEKIERVAAAVGMRRREVGGRFSTEDEDNRDIAIAAIEAMRAPTNEMLAAEDYMREALGLFIQDPADNDFQRGFNEALKVFANEAMGFKWDDPLLWGTVEPAPEPPRKPKFKVIEGGHPVGKSLTSGASSQPADSDGVQPDGGK